MDKLKYFADMEAWYRKKADDEPAMHRRHIADAEAWRLLADTKRIVVAQQAQIKEALSAMRCEGKPSARVN